MPNTSKICDGTFTVDVEDYFQVSAFASRIRPEDWDHYECRVERNTHRVLEIAAKAGTTGTFFVLGWIAERYPQLVRDIQDAGHEIGCHSMWHQLVYDLGPDKFRRDLIDARNVLEDVTGTAIELYRSPSFSVTQRSLWALPILREEGFHTDSSIYPVRHDCYGIPTAPLDPYIIDTSAGAVREFPGMVCEVAGMRVPVGGGGYLRLFPWALTRHLLHRVRRAGRPLNVYIHPWEFDPDQPRIAASLKSRFRHYQNLTTTAGKIERLLSEFSLDTMSTVLDTWPFPKNRNATCTNQSPVPVGV